LSKAPVGQDHHVVGDGDQGSLDLFCVVGCCPSLFFEESVFGFVKDLFDIPAALIKPCNNAWQKIRGQAPYKEKGLTRSCVT